MFSEYMIICIFYILGIIISKIFDMSGALFLTLLIFTVALVRIINKKPQALGILLLSAVFLFGSVRYFGESQNRLYQEFPEKYVTVSGTIYSDSSSNDGGYKNRYILKPDTISYMNKTAKTNKKIILYTKETFSFGTKITASGFLNEIDGIDNEYEFDFSTYYKSKGILASLTAYEIKEIGKDFSFTPEFLVGKARYLVADVIDNHFSGNSAAFLKAIVTGSKNGFSNDYITLLIHTGVYRILYTPFIHISLIFFLATLLPLNKKRRNYFAATLLILYAIANSSSPSITKAALLCVLFLLGKQIFGFGNKMDTLSKTALVMTISNPLLCFNSGFLMSVASTVILYVSYRPLHMWFLRLFAKHKLAGRLFLSKAAALWTTFLIGTLPISAYLFSGVSVYSVIFTIFATPVIIAILILSPFMLLSFGIFGASPLLAPAIGKLIDFVAFLPNITAQLPAYYIDLKTPKISEIVTFYLLWWVLLRVVDLKLKTKKTAVILAFVIGFSISALPFCEPGTLSVYFVNVGQGDGAVLHTRRGETVLIDGGGSATYEASYNIGERVYLPYLISHGLTDIDVAIVSHCHKDHIEGIIAAAERLKIKTIVMPNADQKNQYRVQLEEIAEEKGITVEYLSAFDEILFKSGLCIKFIAPNNAQLASDDPNDTSLVAHVTYGEFSALFTGDSTDKISDAYPSDINLLKVSHHGSDTATSKEYLDRLHPEYAVISVGENNSYNLPSDNVIARLRQSGAKILRTNRHGDIQFKIKKNGKISYKTLKGE